MDHSASHSTPPPTLGMVPTPPLIAAAAEERWAYLLEHSGGPDDLVGGPQGSRYRSRAVLREIRALDAIEAEAGWLPPTHTMWRERLRQRNEQLRLRKCTGWQPAGCATLAPPRTWASVSAVSHQRIKQLQVQARHDASPRTRMDAQVLSDVFAQMHRHGG